MEPFYHGAIYNEWRGHRLKWDFFRLFSIKFSRTENFSQFCQLVSVLLSLSLAWNNAKTYFIELFRCNAILLTDCSWASCFLFQNGLWSKTKHCTARRTSPGLFTNAVTMDFIVRLREKRVNMSEGWDPEKHRLENEDDYYHRQGSYVLVLCFWLSLTRITGKLRFSWHLVKECSMG